MKKSLSNKFIIDRLNVTAPFKRFFSLTSAKRLSRIFQTFQRRFNAGNPPNWRSRSNFESPTPKQVFNGRQTFETIRRVRKLKRLTCDDIADLIRSAARDAFSGELDL